ncbi:MAG TPA: N-acetyltransferase, partial [Candidatus Handelsmanbacteria bacterium]|nr:N-acetyltransferase [Candidatus Handelsmanbacteria bacterium]
MRELTEADGAALFQQFSDAEVTRYYDLETFTDPLQAEQLVALFYGLVNSGFALAGAPP